MALEKVVPSLFLRVGFLAEGSVDSLELPGETVHASKLFAYDLPFWSIMAHREMRRSWDSPELPLTNADEDFLGTFGFGREGSGRSDKLVARPSSGLP